MMSSTDKVQLRFRHTESAVRHAIAISLLVVVLFDAGCSAYSMYWLQSSFFAKFSLRELVDKNQSSAGLDCSVGPGGGGGGGVSGGTGAVGKQESNFNKFEGIACQISDAELFDEVKFMQALKESIEQDLETDKAKIVTKNSDATGFELEYTLNETTGTVKISAKKGPMRYYTLEANLREKSK